MLIRKRWGFAADDLFVAGSKIQYLDWADGGPTAFGSLEVRVGVFAATLWAVIALIGDVGAFQAMAEEHWLPVVGFLIVLSAIFQVYFVVLVWASTRKKERECRLPWWRLIRCFRGRLRPVVSLMWLFNFVMGCMYIPPNSSETIHCRSASRIHLTRLRFMRALIGFVCAYATYLYLLLAVRTVAGNS